MGDQDIFVLYCPKCSKKKEADWMTGSRYYAAQRLDVPYFMCGDCRLIYLDRTSLKWAISSWRKLNRPMGIPSHKYLYQEMLKRLDEILLLYCETAGYKHARFKKNPK